MLCIAPATNYLMRCRGYHRCRYLERHRSSHNDTVYLLNRQQTVFYGADSRQVNLYHQSKWQTLFFGVASRKRSPQSSSGSSVERSVRQPIHPSNKSGVSLAAEETRNLMQYQSEQIYFGGAANILRQEAHMTQQYMVEG